VRGDACTLGYKIVSIPPNMLTMISRTEEELRSLKPDPAASAYDIDVDMCSCSSTWEAQTGDEDVRVLESKVHAAARCR
jgi:hypothetical protein